MAKRVIKKMTAIVAMLSMATTVILPGSSQFVSTVKAASTAAVDTYQQRFLDLYSDMHKSSNGYFSSQGIPYHSVETLMVEAPDYGHVTTSEAMSYYIWLEAMYGKFTGDFTKFGTAWNTAETYMIPTEEDQPSTSMSKYDPSKPATYAPEHDLPSGYPSQLQFNAAVGKDPINSELISAYNTNTMYGMHWLLDVDNWYGFGQRGDGTSKPSYFNTFQRGPQESTWETIPQPCWDAMKFGGKNGYLDIFVGDSTYSKQFKYTNAPDADSRAIQATYNASQWAKEYGKDISTYIGKASKMGDYLRYAMFDKYFRKIGAPTQAGTGRESAHYLLSWYYAWGGGVGSNWSWKIGSSFNHFGYQNPMAAWILSNNSTFKPKSTNGASDWEASLKRQLELYRWLQSKEGGIAGGCTNSLNGKYDSIPAGTPTFYGMAYDEDPVYHDPSSNEWFGMQTWSMQRVAEYYYNNKSNATDSNVILAKNILDKWVSWVKTVVNLKTDGTFTIPSKLAWTGKPDTWTGTYTGNSGLSVSVLEDGTDLGVTGSLANTLLYYSKASGDEEARILAKELLDRMWTLYRDSKGLAAPEVRKDYHRFFDQEVYVPTGWTGKMPNGDVIKPGIKFLDIRSKYLTDPDYAKVKAAYDAGVNPTMTYHRFWAQCDIALAYGLYSILFSNSVNNSSITPTTAAFDKAAGKQEEVLVNMTLNGNTFSGIKNGTTLLAAGTDYTVSRSTVTIPKSYLAKQAVGSTTLTFDFSAGIDPDLTIKIIDSSVVIPPEGNVKLQFYNGSKSATSGGISPLFKVVNTGTTAINLADLKIRYYYTIDGEKSQNFWADYSSIGASNITGSFVKMTTPKTNADYYLEVGFTSTAGSLAAGQSIEVQVRFSKADWSNYTQTNDYSFNSTGSSYSDWNKVTGYLGGTLQWGTEP